MQRLFKEEQDPKNCFVCSRIDDIKKNQNPFFITELQASYVVLGDYQFFKGYTVVISKTHTNELHKLPSIERTMFLQDMTVTAEAMYYAFKPKKLNYELLGNSDEHLHWHLFPRYENDPSPTTPVWLVPKEIRNASSVKPSPEQLAKDKKALYDSLIKIAHLSQ